MYMYYAGLWFNDDPYIKLVQRASLLVLVWSDGLKTMKPLLKCC